MDLLGYFRQETGNQNTARRKSVHGIERRYATAVLLGWLPSSLNSTDIAEEVILSYWMF
jgi:hypothetical protein